jgi:hypothetical protein
VIDEGGAALSWNFCGERGKVNLAEDKNKKPALTNEISDETGQYDARFLLWRRFCAQYNVPVETLPSDLSGDIKTKWDELKEKQLHKPAEGR